LYNLNTYSFCLSTEYRRLQCSTCFILKGQIVAHTNTSDMAEARDSNDDADFNTSELGTKE